MTSVSLQLRDRDGQAQEELVISELPSGSQLAGSALLEGQQYRYEISGKLDIVRVEPSELFHADNLTLRHGRIVPRQHVGTLVVVVELVGAVKLSASIKIAPTKLEQVSEYRQMLSDITEHAAEAVLQGFGPTSVRAAAANRDAQLLYQKFAMLESHLGSSQFAAAIAQILGDPDVGWRTVTDRQGPGSPYPVGPRLGREFTAPGPRRPWLNNHHRPALTTMPAYLARSKPEKTHDTAANRFLKYVLESWRELAQALHDGLSSRSGRPKPGPARRGLQAAADAMKDLDDLLGHPLFLEVGSLDRFPESSQVLQKRSGYRQILRMFVLVDAGLELPWDSGAEDVYSPSLRNVAALYEMWCYLTLVTIVGQICGNPQTANAFASSPNGMSLRLKTGAASALIWQTSRRGRSLEVQLMFNHQFTAGAESWTAPMRPDCSVLIRPLASDTSDLLDVWVHFDAKYRVDGLAPIAFSVQADDEPLSRGGAKRDDLLKMHAYRDAIRRTAGAYILYPGDESIDQRQFTEILPGLGAFPLRPRGDETRGATAIAEFLAKVLDHVADQATQHERDRFWRARIYGSMPPERPSIPPVPFLDRPPADTDVLVGYVRGAKHRAWIEKHRSYNLRADGRTGSVALGGRELGARLVLLYERVDDEYRVVKLARPGDWRAVTKQDLISTGYPEPRGHLYLVTSLEMLSDPPTWLDDINLRALLPHGHARGAPFTVTWLDLLSNVQPPAE